MYGKQPSACLGGLILRALECKHKQQKQFYGANCISDNDNPVSGSNTIQQGMKAKICAFLSQERLPPEAAGCENREGPECPRSPPRGRYWYIT